MYKVITVSGKARNGKDTFAEMILNEFECQGKKVKVLHYADMLKYVAEKYFDWDGQKNEEGRTLLQKLGTDIARNKDNDYWVRMLAYTAEMFFTDYDLC